MRTRNEIISIVLVCLMVRESRQRCCENNFGCWNESDNLTTKCERGAIFEKDKNKKYNDTVKEKSFCFMFKGFEEYLTADKRESNRDCLTKCQTREEVNSVYGLSKVTAKCATLYMKAAHYGGELYKQLEKFMETGSRIII